MEPESIRGHLSAACIDVRDQTGTSRRGISVIADVSESTVYRFETGDTEWGGVESMIAVYAKVAGVPPLDIWQRAIDRWRAAQPAAQSDSQRKRLDRAKELARQAEAAAQVAPGEQSRKPRRAEGR